MKRYFFAFLLASLFAVIAYRFYLTFQTTNSIYRKDLTAQVRYHFFSHPLDPVKIFNLINNYRTSHGLQKLVWDNQMCLFTKIRLVQIHTDWSHNGFLPAVKSYYHYVYAGENLGKGFTEDINQVNAWLISPEHLANIVNPHYTDTCIATDHTYAVQEFASF